MPPDEPRKLLTKEEILNSADPLILVDGGNEDRLTLRSLSSNDLDWLQALVGEELSGRDFTVRFLHHQLADPVLSADELAAGADALLLKAAHTWLQMHSHIAADLPDTLADFEVVQAFLHQYVDSERARTTRFLQATILPLTRAYEKDLARLSKLQAQFQPVIHWASWITPARPLIDVSPLNALVNSQFQQTLDAFRESTFPKLATSMELVRESALRFSELATSMESVRESALRFSELATQATDRITRVLLEGFALPIQGILSGLPDLNELLATWKRLVEEEAADQALLEVEGFGFTAHLWDLSFRAGLRQLRPATRSAALTNRMLSITRGEQFQGTLEETFLTSGALRRRWPIVQEALTAHVNRFYYSSTSLLVQQIEGILGDALILRGTLMKKDTKLYERGLDGTLKVNKLGKPIEVRGLTRLLDLSSFRGHPVLDRTAMYLTDELIPERHAIAHGRHYDYGKAKRSAQYLLLLYIWAQEIAVFNPAEAGWLVTISQ